MAEQAVNLVSLIKSRFTSTQTSVREISQAIVDAAHTELSRAPQDADLTREAVLAIVLGAIEGAREKGKDERAAAEATIIAVALIVEQAGGHAMEAVRTAAGGLIRITAELHGDVAKTANGVIDGAAAAARDLGWRVPDAAAAAAVAAMEASKTIEANAAKQVREAVKEAGALGVRRTF